MACDRHLVASAVAKSARRSVCRNSGRESEHAISADSGVFSGSVAKLCANLFSQRYAHNKLTYKIVSSESYLSDISDEELPLP